MQSPCRDCFCFWGVSQFVLSASYRQYLVQFLDQNYLFAFEGLSPGSLNSLAGGIIPSHLTLFLMLCFFKIVYSVKLEAQEAQKRVSPQSAREEQTIEDRVELTGLGPRQDPERVARYSGRRNA